MDDASKHSEDCGCEVCDTAELERLEYEDRERDFERSYSQEEQLGWR